MLMHVSVYLLNRRIDATGIRLTRVLDKVLRSYYLLKPADRNCHEIVVVEKNRFQVETYNENYVQ